MVPEAVNLYEYEEILSGQRKNFSVSFKGSVYDNQKEVGRIWRYAVSNLLKWTPQEAVVNMNKKLVKQLRLERTLVGIGLNPATDYISDYRCVLQYAFPEQIKYDFITETIDDFERFAKQGKYVNDDTKKKLTKKFFTDNNGLKRAHLLLIHQIDTYLSDCSNEEIYELFATKGAEWLKKKHLEPVLKFIYNSPLDYLQNSLSTIQKQDNFLYYLWKIDEVIS